MPPRYTYWTIIIDGAPTAFRAADRETLLPTLRQIQARNPDAVLKWFARGRVWDSPEEARMAAAARRPAQEPRGRDWRPGGSHQDPRERFKKETFQAKKRREKKAAALARDPKPAERGRPALPGGRAPSPPERARAPWRDRVRPHASGPNGERARPSPPAPARIPVVTERPAPVGDGPSAGEARPHETRRPRLRGGKK